MVHLSSWSGNIMQFINDLWESRLICNSKWLHMPIQSRQCLTLFFLVSHNQWVMFLVLWTILLVLMLNYVVAHFESTNGLRIESLTYLGTSIIFHNKLSMIPSRCCIVSFKVYGSTLERVIIRIPCAGQYLWEGGYMFITPTISEGENIDCYVHAQYTIYRKIPKLG